MKLTWLGHSAFRLEIGDQVLLIDPWLDGNPSFPADRRPEATAGATHILLTHAHTDHSGGVPALSRETGAPVCGIFDLMGYWETTEKIETVGFNKGGTLTLGDVSVTMVNACHSSTLPTDGAPVAPGSEAGFMITHGGRTIYVSGDTDIMADMAWMGELHAPEIGILCCGGHFTMDMDRAAWAAKKYFDFKTVIPCHYGTIDVLEQDPAKLAGLLPGVDVRAPAVMETIEI